MKKRPLLVASALIGALGSSFLRPSADLMEELFSAREQDQEKPIIIAQSTTLTQAQKEAIQATLHKLFADQVATSGVYNEMVKVLIDGLSHAQVVAQSKRFIASLNDLIKTYFKTIRLSPEQAVRLRDMLRALQDLVALQRKILQENVVDTSIDDSSVEAVQERLQAHMLPLSNAIEAALSRDAGALYQEGILELLIGIIKETLKALPASSQQTPNKNTIGLPEPSIPEHMPIEEVYDYE